MERIRHDTHEDIDLYRPRTWPRRPQTRKHVRIPTLQESAHGFRIVERNELELHVPNNYYRHRSLRPRAYAYP